MHPRLRKQYTHKMLRFWIGILLCFQLYLCLSLKNFPRKLGLGESRVDIGRLNALESEESSSQSELFKDYLARTTQQVQGKMVTPSLLRY